MFQTADIGGHEPKYIIGVGVELRGAELVVTHLLPGAPAERDGIRKGDALLGLNGRAFGSDPHTELTAAVAGANPIIVKLRRGADVKHVTVTPERL